MLGLDAMLAEAAAAGPMQAAVLYRTVADSLDQNGFPGHATVTRRREAEAAMLAGDNRQALQALWPAAVRSVEQGESFYGDRSSTLRQAAAVDGVSAARVGLLLLAEEWKERGTQLERAVPWLVELTDAHDPELTLLACLTLERALADGLFESDPPRSVIISTDESTAGALSELVGSAQAAADAAVDPASRARLACALADAALREWSSPANVEAQYGPLLSAAAAGRYHGAAGLVAARAARAFALHGDPSRAEDLWRRAVLDSSEEGLYGDARGALLSMTLLDAETGTLQWRDLPQVVEALPDRRRLIDGGGDAMLFALAQTHADKLPDALGHARRAVLVAGVSGDLREELHAVNLLGDVLNSAGHPAEAVECWVLAGDGKKAAQAAAVLAAPADVSRWLHLPWRCRSDAAAQVLGAQANAVPDDDVSVTVDALLDTALNMWGSTWMSPHPELSALRALGCFAGRLPAAAVDRLLALCEPAIAGPTQAGHDVAEVLFRVYWAQPHHRDRLAPALANMLEQDDPPYNAWDLAGQLAGAHELLLPTVLTLAKANHPSALITLAAWRHCDDHVQQAARRACSALLRRPVTGSPNHGSLSTQDGTTVGLLLALLDANKTADFPVETFSEAMAWNPGGVIMTIGAVVDEQWGPDLDPQSPQPAQASPARSASADDVAQICAGPPTILVEAVAAHLLRTAEDRTGPALVRVQPVLALTGLINRLEPLTAAGMAPRLLALHRDPGLTETDQFEIRNDVPLSRFRMRGGATDLSPAALLVAALAVRRAANAGPTDDALRVVGSETIAAAIPLLQSDRYALWAAQAVQAIASANLGQETATLLLATHDNDVVRQIGAQSVPATSGLLRVLSKDRGAAVRRAVARRATELDSTTAEVLRNDLDRSVRAACIAASGNPTEP